MIKATLRTRITLPTGVGKGFATLLPHLRDEVISLGKAAKQLGISKRSLRRYLDQASIPSSRPMESHLP